MSTNRPEAFTRKAHSDTGVEAALGQWQHASIARTKVVSRTNAPRRPSEKAASPQGNTRKPQRCADVSLRATVACQAGFIGTGSVV